MIARGVVKGNVFAKLRQCRRHTKLNTTLIIIPAEKIV